KAETDAVYVADLDGDTNKVGFDTFRIDPTNPTYLDPESVTSSHCYERHLTPTDPATGWAYLDLVSATELRVAYAKDGAWPVTLRKRTTTSRSGSAITLCARGRSPGSRSRTANIAACVSAGVAVRAPVSNE